MTVHVRMKTIAAVFVFALCAAFACAQSEPSKLKGTSLDKPAQRASPYSVQQLCAAYEKNAISADAALKGKTVTISGKISKISNDGTVAIEMEYSGAKSVFGVRCELANEFLAEAAKLKAGGTIQLDGVLEGVSGPWIKVSGCSRHR